MRMEFLPRFFGLFWFVLVFLDKKSPPSTIQLTVNTLDCEFGLSRQAI